MSRLTEEFVEPIGEEEEYESDGIEERQA